MKPIEQIKLKINGVKNEYNASVFGRYHVHMLGLNNIVGSSRYRFDTVDDAIRYCKDTKLAISVYEFIENPDKSVTENVIFKKEGLKR